MQYLIKPDFYFKDRVRTIGEEASRLCEIHPEHAEQIQVK